ncbi:putative hydrolase [Mariannaea sp. PMI_226]|nr:putative hydrolase [Mariannaea sp. PMI_226]
MLIRVFNVGVFSGKSIDHPTELCFRASPGNIIETQADAHEKVDGTGCTILPGFIDSKIDADCSFSALGEFASHGVTTVIDSSSGTMESIAMRLASHQSTGRTDYLATGSPAGASAGHGSHASMNFPYRAVREVRNPAEAETFVNGHATGANKSDFIKVIADEPGLDDATLHTLVQATHRRGMIAIAHASQAGAYRRALNAGFDVVTPVPVDGPLDEAVVRGFAEKKIAVIPTLAFLRRLLSQKSYVSDNPSHSFTHATKGVRVLHQAGVPICAGTASNNDGRLFMAFGKTLHEELQLLVSEAGMSNREAIRAATCVASKVFGLVDRGSIETGHRADLVMVRGDPMDDIASLSKIQRVWIKGVEVYKAE